MDAIDLLESLTNEPDYRTAREYEEAERISRRAKGCYVCVDTYRPNRLEEALPIGEYLCPECIRAYNLGVQHGQRWTEGQLLEHDPQW